MEHRERNGFLSVMIQWSTGEKSSRAADSAADICGLRIYDDRDAPSSLHPRGCDGRARHKSV